MAVQARRHDDPGFRKFTAAAAHVSGEIVKLPDGMTGFIGASNGFASGANDAVAHVAGTFEVTKATGTAFVIGEPVDWDTTNNRIAKSGQGDFHLGTLTYAAATADTVAFVDIARKKSPQTIPDPGDGLAIPVTESGYCPLVTAGAETRTLAAPLFPGQVLTLGFKTDGGNCVVTASAGVNQTGNNTLTFADAGDHLKLEAIESGSSLVWRIVANDGVALTTV